MKPKTKSKLMAAAVASILVAGISGNVLADNHTATTAAKGECHGINTCKGTGACGGKGHSCAGKNECKGQGWLKMTEKECKDKGGKFVAKK